VVNREATPSRQWRPLLTQLQRAVIGLGPVRMASDPPVRVNAFGPIPDGGIYPLRRAAIWLVSCSAFILYTVESVLRQAQFKTSVDITIFQQAIANYAHGDTPNVLVKSQEPFNILGDHFSPIMMLLAPAYRIWPSVITLLVAQALFLAIGVHVVTRVAVRRLGGLGYYLGLSFALSWGILKVVDFDFHEACFAVAFLALALEALLDERLGWMLGWCGALLLVKEDTPLYIAGIALVFAAGRRWRWAAGLLTGSVLAFAVLTLVVIPAFSFTGTYTYFALGGSSSGLVPMIEAVLGNLFSVNGIALLGALAITAALGLRSPLILVLVPTLLARLASQREVYLEMKYYYDGPLMVVCVLALVVALQQRRIRLGITPAQIRAWWSSASGLAVAVMLAVLVDYNVHTTELPRTFAEALVPSQWRSDARRLIDEIPAGESVIADVGLLGNITDRNPVTLATADWQDSTHLPLAPFDWVILNLAGNDKDWKTERTDQLLAEGYLLVDQAGTLVLLRR
jgi:uncharacterized membrane protein